MMPREVRRAQIDPEDVAVMIGLALIVVGIGMAWLPLAFIVLGGAIIAAIRYGSAGE